MRARLIVAILLVLLMMVTAFGFLPDGVESTEWDPVQEISTDIGTEDQWYPSITADAGKAHVAWMDRGGGDWDIYYRYFDGFVWQPEQEISTDDGMEEQMYPSIAAENGKVHVAWVDYEGGDVDIYYRYFNGTSWQPEQEISTDDGMDPQWYPSIAVDAGKVHIVWQDEGDGDYDIYYRYFDGTSWQPEQEISTDIGTERQNYPSIAADAGNVHVVWRDYGDGDWDIYYRYFDGFVWQPEQEISTDAGTKPQQEPSIAAENGKVHVAWVDRGGGDDDIYYRYFDGTSWQPEQEISTDIGWEWQHGPSIAADAGKVHVAWVSGDSDIHYRYFNGTSWQPEQEISTDIGTEGQYRPSIAADAGKVHVVWEDRGGGDDDIYYRRGTEEIGDITPPESNANPILPYWQMTSTFDIEWTATDDIDLANISLYYRYSSDNSSWSDWEEWAYNNTISGTLAIGSFSFTAPYGGGFYEFYTTANDSFGNCEIAPVSADAIAGVATVPLPPSDLDAILSGGNFENVTLSWDLSPDDGTGKNNVARYDIYRGSIYDSNGSSYLLHASVPAGTSSYADAQAGEGNSSNYLYRVCAVSDTDLSSCAANQAGKFTRPLSIGPNLISIPLIQSNESIESVLQTVKYDKAWYYDSSSQEWKWYMKSKGYRRGLWSMNHTMGLWVNVTNDCNLTVAGVVPAQTTIHLHKGWNPVSFPSFSTTYTVADLKADIGATRVEGYDPAPPYFLRVLGNGEVLQAGYGHWVRVDIDVDWIVEVT